jgi:hypothetical protein
MVKVVYEIFIPLSKASAGAGGVDWRRCVTCDEPANPIGCPRVMHFTLTKSGMFLFLFPFLPPHYCFPLKTPPAQNTTSSTHLQNSTSSTHLLYPPPKLNLLYPPPKLNLLYPPPKLNLLYPPPKL